MNKGRCERHQDGEESDSSDSPAREYSTTPVKPEFVRKKLKTVNFEAFNRFKEHCRANCNNRKIRLQDMALGPASALELKKIIKADPSQFS